LRGGQPLVKKPIAARPQGKLTLPMPIGLKQSVIDAYVLDPVLAAHAIFGADLDVFQRCRLRYMWWVPELDDDSGIIARSYRDWSPRFQKDFRPDSMIRRAKLTMSKARFLQQWEGLWAHGTGDWYDSTELRACCSRRVPVLTRSPGAKTLFTLGTDTAPGATRKADFNAWVVTAAAPLPPDTREVIGVFRHGQAAWRIRHGRSWRTNVKLIHGGDESPNSNWDVACRWMEPCAGIERVHQFDRPQPGPRHPGGYRQRGLRRMVGLVRSYRNRGLARLQRQGAGIPGLHHEPGSQ
jgi:hypothetical protein